MFRVELADLIRAVKPNRDLQRSTFHTYLFFIKSLDMTETKKRGECPRHRSPVYGADFPGDDYGQSLRWNRFKTLSAEHIFDLLSNHVFPFIKGESSTIKLADGKKHIIEGMRLGQKTAYAKYMKGATFSLTQLSSEAVNAAFSKFLNRRLYSEEQVQFVVDIIGWLAQNGTLSSDDLMDDENFGGLFVADVFREQMPMWAEIKNIIYTFNRNARVELLAA